MRRTVAMVAVALFIPAWTASAQPPREVPRQASIQPSDELAPPTTQAAGTTAENDLTALLAAVSAGQQSLESRLTRAAATGTIVRRSERNGSVSLVAQDLQILVMGEKFWVQVVEKKVDGSDANLRDGQDPFRDDQPVVPIESKATAAETRYVIFDGTQVLTAIGSAERWSGKIQFAFQQQSALRSIGYPYCPPLKLWRAYAPPNAGREVSVQRLQDQRFILEQQTSSYSTKFYFFADFDYDLRRIAYLAPTSVRPFREVSYEWDEVDGIRFVSRFSVRERHVPTDPADLLVEVNDLTIEFQHVDVDPPGLDDNSFSLSKLPLPAGSQFDDHRSNQAGKPVSWIWDGEQLVQEAVKSKK